HNLATQLGVAAKNWELVTFLLKEVTKSKNKKLEELYRFYPDAPADAWEMITAGQRVQMMRKDENGKAMLQFGTELVTGADGSIAGLLGASPGASTTPSIMFRLLERCFPSKMDAWRPKLQHMVPSYGRLLNDDPQLLQEVSSASNQTLK